MLAPQGRESLLDVTTAAGHTAFALAPLVAKVTGLYLTPEMGREFADQARLRGITNARFASGDVDHLPFPDGTFDLVTCRRAAHHFPSIPAAVAEMVRVLRTGGRLGIADMATPEEIEAAALFNAMEVARDSSHQRALSPSGWRATVAAAGLAVEHLAAPPAVAAQVVRPAADGTLLFWKRRVVLVASKP